MNDRNKKNEDVHDLINLLEYMVPSYGLDMLTLIIIAAGNINEANCAVAYGQEQKSHSACNRVRNLDIFNLIR
jgi:hypothetical protein